MSLLYKPLRRTLRVYKFEKQYKKDKLSPETIKANRQTDILPILGDIYQKLTLYAKNVTGECGTLLMKVIHIKYISKPSFIPKRSLCKLPATQAANA